MNKDRVEKKEITAATLRNSVKVLKLFCEMNEILLPWKRITRGLPKARRYADDSAFHTIVSGDPVNGPSNIFYSPLFGSEKTFTFMFTKPCKYPYYDDDWRHMTRQVEAVVSANDTNIK